MSLRVFSAPASRQSSGLFHVHMAQSTRMCAGLRCNSMGSRAVGRSLGRAQVAKKTHAFIATSAAPLRVTCMANQRRVAKVQQQMRREISNMMQTDKVSPGKSWPGRLLRRWPCFVNQTLKPCARARVNPNLTKPFLQSIEITRYGVSRGADGSG